MRMVNKYLVHTKLIILNSEQLSTRLHFNDYFKELNITNLLTHKEDALRWV